MPNETKVLGRWSFDPMAISPEDQRSLDHVAEVSRNARATWFSLILLLLFCGVTLLGVEDKDFFEYGVSTQLPLVGVSVPTKSFFWAAPLLVTGLFTYLHLYLDKLWRALRRLEDKVGGRPVTEVVYPWLISDCALGMRGSRVERGSYWMIIRVVSLFLCWMIAPAILFLFWIKSWAPHDEWMTSLIGAQLVGCGVIALASWVGMHRETPRSETLWQKVGTPVIAGIGLVAVIVIGGHGWGKTEGGAFGKVYGADLYRANFTRPDKDWMGRERALREYKRENRQNVIKELQREAGAEDIPAEDAIAARLLEEFKEERRDGLSKLQHRNWAEVDLRRATLREANFTGLNTKDARFEDADLRWAIFEEADLRKARFVGANLRLARLEGVSLINAKLERANLRAARLQDAVFRRADLKNANLHGAWLHNADLRRARLEGANLQHAKMRNAVTKYVSVVSADFRKSRELTQDQLDVMYGDGDTLIDGTELKRPAHWPSIAIPEGQRVACWKEWAISQGAKPRWFPATKVKCTTHADLP